MSQSEPMGEFLHSKVFGYKMRKKETCLYLMKLKKCIEEERGSKHNRMEIPVFHSSRHLKSQS